MKLKYHPTLFRLLEMLEYKALLLKERKDKLYERYEARLSELLKLVSDKKIDPLFPS
jgi:hypothetical protein